MTQITTPHVKAALGILTAVADAIRDLKEVPSGHLYANLMSKLSFAQYEQVIGVLKSTGLIKENAHLLTWVGPAPACPVCHEAGGNPYCAGCGWKPAACPDCGKPTNQDGACETCAASTCCECGKAITPAADLSLGVCDECTEKAEHEEEGRR
jgi:hypothetical protein